MMAAKPASKLERLSSHGKQDSKAKISVAPAEIGLKGEAVQVVAVVEDHGFKLIEEELEKILFKPEVINKPVVVVSVAGAFRKGKSFLLNFFIRYLNHYTQHGHCENWLGDQTKPLAGFNWRGGSERMTTGILMWSEPFITTAHDGQQVAVLLMDTQGAFDTESTVKQCATIFALSTMLSSVQVYNLHSNIQENDLQHLQLFTEYGKLAADTEDSSIKPFQSLLFLVRDWSYPYDNAYGIDGGNQLLDKRLQLSEQQHPELQLLRQQIRNCFETIDCFLMAHPGLKVATKPNFDGRIAEIEPDFQENLEQLVPLLLSPDNLIVKCINNNVVSARDLVTYFKIYMRIFSGNELPEPKSLMQATAEANNLVALTSARSLYESCMNEICGGEKPFINPDILCEHHDRVLSQALDAFDRHKKLGGPEISDSYRQKLLSDIDEIWDRLRKSNDAKSLLFTFRTPIVLFGLFMVFYILSGMTSMVGISPLTSILNAGLLIILVLCLLWSYCRYTGEIRELGASIDHMAQIIYDLVSGPLQDVAAEGAQRLMHQSAIGNVLGGLQDRNSKTSTVGSRKTD